MLFTGLRIAVVNAIGTAVFASSVGGGGLGNLINTGIRRNDVSMILSGTAALMAMALLLDNLMAFCERRMGRRDSSRRPGRHAVLRRRLTAGAAAVLVAALCLPSLLPKDTSSTLVLYDGEFSEVQLVNRMVQQLVEDRTGLEVSILDPMTSINNFKELTAREPSCDLMYTWGRHHPDHLPGAWTPVTSPRDRAFTTSSTAASGSSTAPVCWARSAWTTPTPSASPRR